MTASAKVEHLVRQLPPDLQEWMLELAQRLAAPRTGQARKLVRGSWRDRGGDISIADIRALRKEMWRNFPRKEPPA